MTARTTSTMMVVKNRLTQSENWTKLTITVQPTESWIVCDVICWSNHASIIRYSVSDWTFHYSPILYRCVHSIWQSVQIARTNVTRVLFIHKIYQPFHYWKRHRKKKSRISFSPKWKYRRKISSHHPQSSSSSQQLWQLDTEQTANWSGENRVETSKNASPSVCRMWTISHISAALSRIKDICVPRDWTKDASSIWK